MPMPNKKLPRNCENQTQQRDPKTGHFLRRHDDDTSHVVCSRPQMFGEANAAASQRSALSRAERQSRNSSVKVNFARGYDASAIEVTRRDLQPGSKRPKPAKPPTRQQKQQARERSVRLAKLRKATAGRKPLTPQRESLEQMRFGLYPDNRREVRAAKPKRISA